VPAASAEGRLIETNTPQRLDRLPWSGWHTLVVIALGVTWLLDGLENNLAGALAGILKLPQTLGLTDADIGLASTIYLIGAVIGALVFGYATESLGRKRLFSITLLLYLSATAATAFSWNLASFTFFRALTGAGIGGEYSAINSAVDELIPARVRGHVALLINHFLDRRGAGLGRVADHSEAGAVSGRYWMAFRVRYRRGDRSGNPHHAQTRAGKSALAGDPRM